VAPLPIAIIIYIGVALPIAQGFLRIKSIDSAVDIACSESAQDVVRAKLPSALAKSDPAALG
jgi:hypothetical protein